MSFDYHRLKQRSPESGEKSLGSYSDLFALLFFIALFLYVVTSLQNAMVKVSEHQQARKMEQKLNQLVNEYEQQLQIYVSQDSSQAHASVQKLMARMERIEARDNKEVLEKQAALQAAESKLTEVRSMKMRLTGLLDANKVAMKRLKQMRRQNKALAEKANMSKQELADFQAQADSKIEQAKAQHRAELDQKYQQKISEKETQLTDQLTRIAQQREQEREAQYQKQVQSKLAEVENKIAEVESEYSQKEAELNQKYQAELSELEKNIQSTEAKLQQSENQNSEQFEQLAKLQSAKKGLEGKIGKLKKRARAREEFREDLASKLQGAFDKAFGGGNPSEGQGSSAANGNFIGQDRGVQIKTDGATGDVLLLFHKSFFAYGSSKLQSDMEEALKKIVPVYAQTLFEDPKVAEKISAVELIGYASPSYGGKYVDPTKLDAKTKLALSYNMDLSYRRAKSIFDLVFDTKSLKFDHQENLMQITKVAGRSYLASKKNEENTGREISSVSGTSAIPSDQETPEFCQSYNCRAEQRVLIRFTLSNKFNRSP